ncbi:MAG TPA: polyprenyl synthetase family protein [Alphaproteobacteria bacterium]|nr:polyprenyl synthetase family protein [Alphaproteobacteria bacterium]
MGRLQQSLLILKNNPFAGRLCAVARDVELVLDNILPPRTTQLHEAMRYSVLGGGKRLRAYFTWASSQLFDVSHQDALQTAAVIELIHAYSLVHDDLPCMDNADIRRGKPSCHKAFGEATATLVGDALIPLAFQTFSSLEATPEVRLELIKELGHVIGSQGLVAGQMMDLGQEGPRSTLEDLSEQQRLKTGVLFGFAAEAGGILGNASPHERRALRSFGLLFGKSFQMVDDWLDGCGDEDAIGKPCGQDNEKFTFLNLLGPTLLYQKAEETLEEALKALSPFKERAYLLREAAVCALHRFS